MKYLHIERIQRPNPWFTALVYFLSVLTALLAGAVLLSLNGLDPGTTYLRTFTRVFASQRGIVETLVRAIPIYLGAFAVSVAARLKLWNIGVEGQFLMGAFAASGIALFFPKLSSPLLLALMLGAAFLGGALLSLLSAIPRAKFGINEIVVTLLMNYVVVFWIAYLVHGPWKSAQSFVPQTDMFSAEARLPLLIPGTRLHIGLLVVVIIALLMEVVLRRTTGGYLIRAAGSNPRAAASAGIHYEKLLLAVMFFSGGLAGIGGMLEVSGTLFRLQEGIYPFYIMSSVMTAWLARLNTWMIFPTGFLVAGLLTASYTMQILGLPGAVVTVLQAVILFSVIAFAPLSYFRVRLKRGEG